MVLQINEIIVVVFLFIIIKKMSKCHFPNRVTHSTQLYYAGKNI